MDIMEILKKQVEENSIILYMKGTPQFPQCGFSSQTVDALSQIGREFAYVNVLEHPEIRANLPVFANWPTFPQLWVNGELVGGCDIVMELARSGELNGIIESAAEQPES